MELERVRPINGKAPRCPYCHEDVRQDHEQRVCSGCAAAHHTECWSEHGRCSSCGVEAEAPETSAARLTYQRAFEQAWGALPAAPPILARACRRYHRGRLHGRSGPWIGYLAQTIGLAFLGFGLYALITGEFALFVASLFCWMLASFAGRVTRLNAQEDLSQIDLTFAFCDGFIKEEREFRRPHDNDDLIDSFYRWARRDAESEEAVLRSWLKEAVARQSVDEIQEILGHLTGGPPPSILIQAPSSSSSAKDAGSQPPPRER